MTPSQWDVSLGSNSNLKRVGVAKQRKHCNEERSSVSHPWVGGRAGNDKAPGLR